MEYLSNLHILPCSVWVYYTPILPWYQHFIVAATGCCRYSMRHAFGLEGLHIFLQPWQWGPLSCFLSAVFCLNHNYSCKVSGKEYNLGGWEEGGREGKAYHHSTLIVFTFPLPLSLPLPPSPLPLSLPPSPSPFPLPLPPKITFKETKVNTEPYGSILIQQAIILNVFLVIRDPRCIDPLKSGKNIFSYILKFTWQPGGQSDIVWCYFGLQI